MPAGSANQFPKVIFIEGGAPGTPPSGIVYVYAKADGLMYSKDDAGAETLMSGGSSGAVSTDSIWDAAGDLVQGSGANTGAKLGAGLAGQMLRSAGAAAANAWAYPPGYEFDYAAITSSATATATSEATATAAVTGAAIAYDGSTTILISFQAGYALLDTNTAGKGLYLYLYDGSSSLGLLEYRANPTALAGGMYGPAIHVERRLTPSAATHTYSIRIAKDSGGTTTMLIAAAATSPAFMRIVKA